MATEIISSLSPDQISNIIDVLLVVVSVVVPGSAIYVSTAKKVKDELIHVLDKSSQSNRSLKKLAETEGKAKAAKVINNLLNQRAS